MDYLVPSVEKLIEDALQGGHHYDGVYTVARAVKQQWDDWEVLDERAVVSVGAAIEWLQELKHSIELAIANDAISE